MVDPYVGHLVRVVGMSELDREDLPRSYVFATAASELAGHVEDDPYMDEVALRLARGEITGDEARDIVRQYTLRVRT